MSSFANTMVIFNKWNAKFQPGEKVDGQVIMRMDQDVTARSIRVKWMGEALVDLQETRVRGQTYLSGFEIVWQAVGRKHVLPAGTHKFPFSFDLPRDCPSTNVDYHVEVELDIPWKENQQIKKRFHMENGAETQEFRVQNELFTQEDMDDYGGYKQEVEAFEMPTTEEEWNDFNRGKRSTLKRWNGPSISQLEAPQPDVYVDYQHEQVENNVYIEEAAQSAYEQFSEYQDVNSPQFPPISDQFDQYEDVSYGMNINAPPFLQHYQSFSHHPPRDVTSPIITRRFAKAPNAPRTFGTVFYG